MLTAMLLELSNYVEKLVKPTRVETFGSSTKISIYLNVPDCSSRLYFQSKWNVFSNFNQFWIRWQSIINLFFIKFVLYVSSDIQRSPCVVGIGSSKLRNRVPSFKAWKTKKRKSGLSFVSIQDSSRVLEPHDVTLFLNVRNSVFPVIY